MSTRTLWNIREIPPALCVHPEARGHSSQHMPLGHHHRTLYTACLHLIDAVCHHHHPTGRDVLLTRPEVDTQQISQGSRWHLAATSGMVLDGFFENQILLYFLKL